MNYDDLIIMDQIIRIQNVWRSLERSIKIIVKLNKMKIMFIAFFDWHGIIHHEFVADR